MKTLQFFLGLMALLFAHNVCLAQLPKVRFDNGKISIEGVWGKIDEKKYKPLMDSLNNKLKSNPKDTTSLFYKALLLEKINNLLAKPYQQTKGALENLLEAKNIIEKASGLGVKSLNFKILKAQIYLQIAYRYTSNESWMFTKKEIAERRKQYEFYKVLANKCVDELMLLDKQNAYIYDSERRDYKPPVIR